MDSWDLEWTVETTDLKQFKSEYIGSDEDDFIEFTANSPEPSGESGGEKSDENDSKNELELNQNKLKNVALAKKRLQAYTNKLPVKQVPAKSEKNEESDKTEKNVIKKLKKDYPDDRAKAVIQEIEEIKKKEAQRVKGHFENPLKNDPATREAVAAAIQNIKNYAKMRERSRSVSSERDRRFRKREIKRRNYRRTESYDRRSNSPEERNRKNRKSSSSSAKQNYPKNWNEYNEEKLTTVKDEELKSKIFKQKTNSNLELFCKLYNFETPAPFIEPFKYSTETETREVPFSHFRVTRAHPKISFSANFQKTKESFISRLQLFQIIPSSRRQLIEKLINSSGKSHSTAKRLETRSWYSRMWKKKDAECKVLENSVGLSFLQNYSDEEEEIDNDDVVICSSTKPKKKKDEPNMTLSDIKEIQEKITAKAEPISEEPKIDVQVEEEKTEEELKVEESKIVVPIEKVEKTDEVDTIEIVKTETVEKIDKHEKIEKVAKAREVATTEEKTEQKSEDSNNEDQNEDECEPGEIIDDSESVLEDEREYTPEKELLIPKLLKEEEIMKTKRAIKMLEKELAKRNEEKALEEIISKKDKSKKKKEKLESKEKRKDDKKKKKKKSPKVEEENVSDDEEEKNLKSKKKKKKIKKKKEVSEDESSSEDEKTLKKAKKKEKKKEKQKKKNGKKETLIRESKSKQKEEMSEEESPKRDSKKKKKKESETTDEKEEKVSKKKNKKKKTKKKKNSESSSSSDESVEEKPSKKDKKKTKKSKKKQEIELENILVDTVEEKETVNEYEEKSLKSDVAKKSDSRRKESRWEKERSISETSADNIVVEYTDLRQKLVAKSGKLKGRKESKTSVEFKSPGNRNDLRWELLENKRKRREEEFEDFPLEKDTFPSTPPKVTGTNTPDTDEYLGNWEKDSDAVWESEDEQPPKPQEKLNSSWESDDEYETFERRPPENVEIRSFKDSLDLEIPLNIKPFKRRPEPIIDPDTELEFLKIESKNLSEERKRLEIEKIKVKELELRVTREMESKIRAEGSSEPRSREERRLEIEKIKVKELELKGTREMASKTRAERSSEPRTREERSLETRVTKEMESKAKEERSLETEVVKDMDPKVKEENSSEGKVISEVENKAREEKPVEASDKNDEEKYKLMSPKSVHKMTEKQRKVAEDMVSKEKDKSISKTIPEGTEKLAKNALIDLDKIQEKSKVEISKPKRDRWDQRIAATSTPIKNVVDLTGISTPEKSSERDDVVIISSSTEAHESSAVLENEYEQFIKAVSSDPVEKTEKIIVDIPMKPIKPSLISPKDIPFIPMPSEIKPVPVPSPKLDAEKIPSSLINLSLSANITLDITSKIDSPSRKSLSLVSSPVPTPQIAPISKTEAIVSSSTVDIKIKNEEKPQNIKSIAKFDVPNVDFQIGSPLNDKLIVASGSKEKNDKSEINKPLMFGGMTIPTKKSLLNNSNLKLNDSDEEDDVGRSSKMRTLDDIKKEGFVEEVPQVSKAEMIQDMQRQAAIPKVQLQEAIPEVQPQEGVPVVVGHNESLGEQGQKRMRSRSPQAPRHIDSKQMRRDGSPKRSNLGRHSSPVRSRRNESPGRRRSSPGRRHGSPRRSPRRRSPGRKSPSRSRRSPGRKSPRRSPTGKRRYSSRRSNSPSHRRRRGSLSPRRRSPRRSSSPRSSSKRMRSRSPEKTHAPWKSPERERGSRVSAASPLERLKRSVADSTISDDLLPQPSHNPEEYVDSTSTGFYDGSMKMSETSLRTPHVVDYIKEPPKMISTSMKMSETSMRTPLEVDYMKESPKMMSTRTTFDAYDYEQNEYAQMNHYMNPVKNETPMANVYQKSNTSQHSFVQIGNMVEIVPRDLNVKTEFEESKSSQRTKTVVRQEKSQIVQVGNIVQIVPTEFAPEMIKIAQPPLPPPEPLVPLPASPQIKEKTVKKELPPALPTIQEKQSAEEVMKIKIAERKAEREKRRQEKEKKRLEKEKRRKEREALRQVKMKQKTENMIKRALQLEVAAMAEGEASLEETPIQWPPVPIVTGVCKDVGKSILIKGGFSTTNSTKAEKTVKFADGVRPGEGTSPSGGEELSSPPPKKILPKEKRYTKTKLKNKNQKKKVKVKIIKKSTTPALPTETEDDEEDDNLPPPSPPPGSPPPNIWPPRIKPQMINNIHPSFVLAVQAPPPLPPPPVASVNITQQSNQFAQQQLQQQQLQHQQLQQQQLQQQQLQQQQLQQQQLQQQQLHQQQQLFNPAVSLLMAPPPPPPHHHHPPPPPHHPVPHHPPHHGPPPKPPTHHHGPHPPGPPGHHHRPPFHY